MVWVGCSFLWCTIFFVFLLCQPVLWQVDGVDHRDTYASRCSALKNLVTSETADVPPLFCTFTNQFLLCGVPGRGVPAPLAPILAPPLITKPVDSIGFGYKARLGYFQPCHYTIKYNYYQFHHFSTNEMNK